MDKVSGFYPDFRGSSPLGGTDNKEIAGNDYGWDGNFWNILGIFLTACFLSHFLLF